MFSLCLGEAYFANTHSVALVWHRQFIVPPTALLAYAKSDINLTVRVELPGVTPSQKHPVYNVTSRLDNHVGQFEPHQLDRELIGRSRRADP